MLDIMHVIQFMLFFFRRNVLADELHQFFCIGSLVFFWSWLLLGFGQLFLKMFFFSRLVVFSNYLKNQALARAYCHVPLEKSMPYSQLDKPCFLQGWQ